MFFTQDIPLFSHRDMSVDLSCLNGTVPKHDLYVSYVHFCIQKRGGECMPPHVRGDMLLHVH